MTRSILYCQQSPVGGRQLTLRARLCDVQAGQLGCGPTTDPEEVPMALSRAAVAARRDPASSSRAPVNRLTLREQVLAALHGAITSGELPPGCDLAETDLAERYGVSRGTV